MSIKWISSPSDIDFTTSMIGSQELVLSVAKVSRAIHGTNFTCEVINSLPIGITTSTLFFTINTDETSKIP